MSEELQKINDKDKRFTVWVDGTEVNDYYLTEEQAEILAEVWIDDGYEPIIEEVTNV